MNAYAIFAADEALRLATGRAADLRLESAQRRMWSKERTSGRSAIGALIASLRNVFSIDEARPFMPALVDYPFRS